MSEFRGALSDSRIFERDAEIKDDKIGFGRRYVSIFADYALHVFHNFNVQIKS